ncbi:hypothetical protein A8U91_00411 [Halomonas elongata]|uniref:Uncharacterized protein n=1 Tax=Halomonas elongata TaxID=2746 RepID=A0A1B8P1C1_HALEL|nr:hypothetical protein A8U91_00411 [Halomonas elongata]
MAEAAMSYPDPAGGMRSLRVLARLLDYPTGSFRPPHRR